MRKKKKKNQPQEAAVKVTEIDYDRLAKSITKDSGVQWIGKMPKHWSLYRIDSAYIGTNSERSRCVFRH